MSAIRGAKEWRKRPTAVIMRDDWYGHRDPFTGDPRGDRDEYTAWDHALVDAFQTIEDYSDEYGLLPWVLDDEYIDVYANKRIHKFKASVDRATKGSKSKAYEPVPGEYFTPEIVNRRSNGKRQTIREWFEKKAAEEAEKATTVE